MLAMPENAPPAANGRLLNTMDNAAFETNGEMPHRTASTTVEMGELTRSLSPRPVAPSAPLCKPDLCRAMRPIQTKPPTMRPNPWHRYKTILLVATVVGLIVWAIAYFSLEYFGFLK